MLRLFGIPYITAPMEAEAQCAELLSLGLVDGIITDDSDVFLFGGTRVFKNMFNQSKTVECFLATDLERELGLDRDKLIRLADLLGSDYTEGLPGVGPVVAMELLTEFAGIDGLHKFKDWWRKVQSGRDSQKDSQARFRKRFVGVSYATSVINSGTEQGFPPEKTIQRAVSSRGVAQPCGGKRRMNFLCFDDSTRFSEMRTTILPWTAPRTRSNGDYQTSTHSGSRDPLCYGEVRLLKHNYSFFHAELGWQAEKTDDSLLPIIRKMNQRSQVRPLL